MRSAGRTQIGRAILLAAAPLLLAAGLARAHAYIESSEPADGAVLAEPPAAVRVRYTEPIEPRLSALRLLDAEGRPVAGTGLASEGDRALVLKLPPLPEGKYTVESEVLAKDGHVYSEALQFTVAAAGEGKEGAAAAEGAKPAPAPAAEEGKAASASGGTVLLAVAALLLAGGLAFLALKRRTR